MADYIIVNGELYHHGIKGMKWGRRRWQNADGSLTPAGKKRYVTNLEAHTNANNAAKEARKQSIAKSRETESGFGSYRRAMNKASAAARQAREDSFTKDRDYNRQLRAEKENHSDMRKDFDAKKDAYRDANREYNKAFNKAYNKAHQAYSLSKKKRDANDKRWEEAADKAEAMVEAKNAYKDVKKARKQAIKDTHKELRKQTSFKDKLMYNDATRKQAAKYIVDRNMTVEQATSRANADARRNTAIILAAYGGMMVGSAILNNR